MTLKPNMLELIQGKTFTDILRWETAPIVYKPISGILQSAPARVTANGHGMPNGWRCAVTTVKGMTEINATANSIRESDYHQGTVIDVNTIDINDINAAGFKAYTSGGILQYNTPKVLTGYKARMAIKSVAGEYNLLICTSGGAAGTTKPEAAGVDGGVTWEATTLPATKEWIAGATYAVNDVIDAEALLFLTTENSRIAIDVANFTITRTISAADIAAQTWKKGYYDLELVSPDGTPVVTLLDFGTATIGKENTR